MKGLNGVSPPAAIAHQNFTVECAVLVLHFNGVGSVVLIDGSASIFCANLTRNARYHFDKRSIPIEVPVSARFDVEGDFVAHHSVLDSTVEDLNAVLDAARADAFVELGMHRPAPAASPNDRRGEAGNPDEEAYAGPRVLVVGDQNMGKSSLCRALVNLGVRGRRCGITFVDADVGQQGVSCPGSVSAVFMEGPVPVDEAFNAVMPLSFFFGSKVVTVATRKRYLDLCACIAQAATAVGFAKPHFQCGGMIINTMGWTTGLGQDLLIELAAIFSATHVIVAGSDVALETAMENSVLGRSVRVMRYPKQSLILKRNASLLAEMRTQQLVSYFVGTPRTPLLPARLVAKTTEVYFLNSLTLDLMSWQDIKSCSLAAVVWADSVETAAEANVAGYIVLLEIGKRFFSFLSPASGALPKPYLLVSSTISLPPSKVPPLGGTA
ncbi:unnamed protein product [Phytomonas sp. EM1]|nr:unnamed protein product [Phytomonas sp. EM1]|eukprot:CCW61595.1 unnamed protein product [Phytomonas sp. isolate EM1]